MYQIPSTITASDQIKLDISEQETFNLKERDICCPHCRFLIYKVYQDVSGHMRVKCPKCKRCYAVNLQMFRTTDHSTFVSLIRIIE